MVRFGITFGRWEYALLLVTAYGSVVGAVVVGWAPWGWLTCLLTAPLAVVEARAIGHLDGAALNPHLGRTAALEMAFGLSLGLGSFL